MENEEISFDSSKADARHPAAGLEFDLARLAQSLPLGRIGQGSADAEQSPSDGQSALSSARPTLVLEDDDCSASQAPYYCSGHEFRGIPRPSYNTNTRPSSISESTERFLILADWLREPPLPKMEHDQQPDIGEYFNFAAASLPEEDSQLDVTAAFSTSDMLNSATRTCPAHPEGIE